MRRKRIGSSCGYPEERKGNLKKVLCWIIGHRVIVWSGAHRYPVNTEVCKTCNETKRYWYEID